MDHCWELTKAGVVMGEAATQEAVGYAVVATAEARSRSSAVVARDVKGVDAAGSAEQLLLAGPFRCMDWPHLTQGDGESLEAER